MIRNTHSKPFSGESIFYRHDEIGQRGTGPAPRVAHKRVDARKVRRAGNWVMRQPCIHHRLHETYTRVQAAYLARVRVEIAVKLLPVCIRIRGVDTVQELPAINISALQLTEISLEISQHRERHAALQHGQAPVFARRSGSECVALGVFVSAPLR